MKEKMKTIDLELTRSIPATPEEVYDGWLDPKCPGTPWNLAAKFVLDPKVDGLFYWLYVGESDKHTPHYGRFTLVERPAKIQYTWVSPHTHGRESLVTVTFQQQGEDTLMKLRHENLPDDESGRNHEKGWGFFLGKFAEGFGGRKAN
ncbi:SRPBCC domain-containing protein [Telmatocola sphagniphila]|uniref:SRPBCC domain-containing protein n=1 Tax=Telmatocola sphagniphila TaxID=1123043 RepID=A0A8E6B416_9BACT|nr:SRPBCC domain-containing protein [Telmatocola sphagniphila]QVL30726.1 SRPBCC domain-containing protein [Telmatocola sphagniphila]